MANPTAAPQPRVLIVDDELAKLDTALGRAVNQLAAAKFCTNSVSVMRRRQFFSLLIASARAAP